MTYSPGTQVIVTMPDGHEHFGVVVNDERETPTLEAINRGRIHIALGTAIEIVAPPDAVREVAS